MNKEELREYCLSMNGASEYFPFDEVSLVFKIQKKMFAVLPLDAEDTCISMKCDPDRAIELREKYVAVKPAYHFNKKHWNTVYTENTENPIPDKLVKELIKHSYDLVVKKISGFKNLNF
jgi:predicted DNA-binding protein (MmcQ/YjbR family)